MRAPQHSLFQRFPTQRQRPRPTLRTAALALALTLPPATGCRSSVAHLLTGPNGPTTAPADQLFSSFAARFTSVHREPKVRTARNKLAQGALIPSRIFDDTAAWSTINSSTLRTFAYRGSSAGGQYRMVASLPSSLPPHPSLPGSTRHVITLARLGDEEFRWDVATDFSLGASGSANVADVFGALFAAAERRSEAEIRADYRTAFSRTSKALGALFSIDSLRATPRADGSTLVEMTIDIHPDGLRSSYPLFAKYLEKYVSPGVMRHVLRDRANPSIVWVVADARNERIRLQLRSRHGRLLPIAGPARAMPDTLELESLVSAKIGIFRVGFERLGSDVVISRDAREPGWMFRFRREPEWKLPLFTESLIRSSLRRPFQQGGAYFYAGLRDEGGQTLLVRRGQLVVQEGTILRFLGRLGGRAYSDLSEKVEREIQDWLSVVFNAMRADARGLGP